MSSRERVRGPGMVTAASGKIEADRNSKMTIRCGVGPLRDDFMLLYGMRDCWSRCFGIRSSGP